MEFMGDQGRDVLIVRDFLKNGNFFFIGPQTSIGNMYLGPYFYYLIAPALFLSNYNPVGPAIFMALLGVLTVALIYLISSYWFNQKTAIFASILYAISPVVIKYSNFSWNPNIMPLFSLLFVFFIGEAIVKRKYKYFLLASVSFVFAINSHFLALILLPVLGIFWLFHLIILIKSKDNHLKLFLLNTFLALVIFLISLTPQILFDIKHQGQNINAFINFFKYRETTVNLKPYKALPGVFSLFNKINSNLFFNQDTEKNSLISTVIFIVFILLTFIKIKDVKNIKNQFFLLNITWLIFGLIGLGLYKQHLYNHYFGFLFPIIFILFGFLLSKIFSLKLLGKPLSILLLIIISFFSLKSNPFWFTPNYQARHAYGIAKAISEHYSEVDGESNVALLASYNDYRGLATRYFLENNFSSINLLNQETYPESNTLFVVIDDPQKWVSGVNSDVWEIKSIGKFKIKEEFVSQDNTKIIKIAKDFDDQKKADQ